MNILVVLAALVACITANPTVRIDPSADWRVVGGSTASTGQFPFIASQRSGSTTNHMCGGSIINNRWILTAAHCQSSGTITYVVGSNQLLTGGVRLVVSRRIIHGSYDSDTNANDVAVIQVSSSIGFTTLIQPVALSTSNTGGGVAVTLAGWGRLSEGGSIPNNLQFLHKTTITVGECHSALSPYQVFASNLCTTVPSGQGACHSDSGGPLVLRNSNTQVGIVSWGIPCGLGFPDVYARVSSFITWINNAISS